MRTVIEAPEIRADKKDLPPKNRVWGFRVPARHRIRKSAAQVAKTHQENAPTPTTIALGRWFYLSTDPIGIRGGDLNLYAYVMSNPTAGADPLGLESWSEIIERELKKPGRWRDVARGVIKRFKDVTGATPSPTVSVVGKVAGTVGSIETTLLDGRAGPAAVEGGMDLVKGWRDMQKTYEDIAKENTDFDPKVDKVQSFFQPPRESTCPKGAK